MKTCPSCGTKSESKFCPECGADLSSVLDVKVCPNCGAESTTKFCPECGQNLEDQILSDPSVSPRQETAAEEPAFVETIPEETPPQDQVRLNEQHEKAADDTQDSPSVIPVSGETVPPAGKPAKSKKKLFAVIGAIILLLIIIGAFAGGGDDESTTATEPSETEAYTEETTTEPPTTATTTTEPTTTAPADEFTDEDDYDSVAYEDLARDPDEYEGDLIKGSGKVIQVMDGENEVDLRVATSDNGYEDVVLMYYEPSLVDSRILEDDYVTYYGRSQGLYTYESTMGGNITVPLLKVHKIERD